MPPKPIMDPYATLVVLGSVLTIAGLFFVWCIYTVTHPNYLTKIQEALKPGPDNVGS